MSAPPPPRNGTARDFYPDRIDLASLRRAARGCKACDLWERGTQTVFGEGLRRSRIMLVGEQPGDQEDVTGRPFVGPAGRLLDDALEEAGITRDDAYVTNVVKHFKWVARGKRRIHQRPNARQIGACLPWLEAEIDVVQPEIVVLLGATAAQAILGSSFRVTRRRGEILPHSLAPWVTATVHPSAILRAPTSEKRRAEHARFVDDLRKVERVVNGGGRSSAPREQG